MKGQRFAGLWSRPCSLLMDCFWVEYRNTNKFFHVLRLKKKTYVGFAVCFPPGSKGLGYIPQEDSFLLNSL